MSDHFILMRHLEGCCALQEDDSFIDDNDQFDPSPRILIRILRILIENNAIGRTRLAQAANVHYTVLLKHLKWLEQKQYIEYFLENGKAAIRLTQNGRDFAKVVSRFYT